MNPIGAPVFRLVLFFGLLGSLHAADKFYDLNGAAAGLQGGTGTWDTGVTSAWSTASTGTALTIFADGDNAVFGTAGTNTVTVSGTVSANQLVQQTSGTATTISGGTIVLTSTGTGTASALYNNTNTGQTLTLNSAIQLGASQTWKGDRPVTIGGIISDGGSGFSLTSAGSNTLTLNAANTYTGTTTISAGSFVLGGSASLAGPLVIGSGTNTVTGGLSNALNPALTINGGFTTLNGGTKGYKIVLNGGTLELTVTLTTPVTVNSGATIDGNGSYNGDVTVLSGGSVLLGGAKFKNLTFQPGSQLVYDPTTYPYIISASGTLTLGGTLVPKNFATNRLSSGTYRLINYTGTLVNNGMAVGDFGPGVTATLLVDTVNKHIDLQIVNTAPSLRVLFIGNSLTGVNDSPGWLQKISDALGQSSVGHVTKWSNGETLTGQVTDTTTQGYLGLNNTDIVVLQEQSATPDTPTGQSSMYPAARTLNSQIVATGRKTMFYETWGYVTGDGQQSQYNIPSQYKVQTSATYNGTTYDLGYFVANCIALRQGYQGIANELGAASFPCGLIRLAIRQARPDLVFYNHNTDDIHPSPTCGYLNGLIFYTTLFGRSPEGDTSYPTGNAATGDGLSAADAAYLQSTVASMILDDPFALDAYGYGDNNYAWAYDWAAYPNPPNSPANTTVISGSMGNPAPAVRVNSGVGTVPNIDLGTLDPNYTYTQAGQGRLYLYTGGILNVSGTLRLGREGEGYVRQNAGTVTAGTLRFGESASSKGDYKLLGGALTASAVTRGAGAMNFQQTGGRFAFGQFGSPSVPLTLAPAGGIVAPNDLPGSAQIYGSFAPGAGATLERTLIASDNSLAITGTATLGGNLTLAYGSGFTPAHNQRFTVLTAGAVTGTFATTTLPAVVNGQKLVLTYTTNSVLATAVNAASSDVTPPVITTPANMTVSAPGYNGATVTFTVTANDAVDGAVSVVTVPASGSTFPEGATTVNCYALDGSGNQATASFTVTVLPPAPSTVTTLAATPGGLQNTLAWSPSTGAVSYTVQRSTTVGGLATTLASGLTATSYTDLTATPGTLYYYTVVAVNTGGSSADSAPVAATSLAVVNRATGGTATASKSNATTGTSSPAQAFDGIVTNVSANKWWTGSSTTPTPAAPQWIQYQFASPAAWIVTQYKITSADSAPRDPQDWTLQASNNGTTWTVIDTQSGQTFGGRYVTNTYTFANAAAYAYYRLNVTGNVGATPTSNGVAVAELQLLAAATAPAAPTNLAASVHADTELALTWTDNATDETAYAVERSAHNANTWTTLTASLPADTAAFTDFTAAAATAYDYRVRALNGSTPSGYAVVSVTTPAAIGDGIPGWWRYQYFGNGTSIIPGVSGPNDNPDGDALTNAQEYLAGTDPNSAASTLTASIALAGSDILVSFPSVSGKSYLVERTTDLTVNPWPTILQDNIAGTGATITVTDPGAALQPRVFYRARVKP